MSEIAAMLSCSQILSRFHRAAPYTNGSGSEYHNLHRHSNVTTHAEDLKTWSRPEIPKGRGVFNTHCCLSNRSASTRKPSVGWPALKHLSNVNAPNVTLGKAVWTLHQNNEATSPNVLSLTFVSPSLCKHVSFMYTH